jgi:succinoglycan biosynthesis transport protein ExoP
MIALAALRRRWLVVALLAVLGALAGLAAGLALTPRYAATASVLIGGPRPQFAELEQLVGGLPLSKDTVANEIELLQSRHLAKKVIAELELQRLPEFNPALGEGGLGAAIRDAKAQVKLWLSAAAAEVGLPYGAGDSSAILAERDELESVVDTFLKQLHVTIRGPSQVLDVTVKSMEPELAAVAANSLARHYLVDRAAAHTDAATRASDWRPSSPSARRRSRRSASSTGCSKVPKARCVPSRFRCSASSCSRPAACSAKRRPVTRRPSPRPGPAAGAVSPTCSTR